MAHIGTFYGDCWDKGEHKNVANASMHQILCAQQFMCANREMNDDASCRRNFGIRKNDWTCLPHTHIRHYYCIYIHILAVCGAESFRQTHAYAGLNRLVFMTQGQINNR